MDYYTNLHGTPEYLQWRRQFDYVEAPEYLQETETPDDLGDGLTVEVTCYRHLEQRHPQYTVCHAEMAVCTLLRDGEPVFQWKDIGGHVYPYLPVFRHANGRRYLPFREDLYGIGFLDADSLECFQYLPRGYAPPEGCVLGESFIITALHYDPQTNLVAYEGCFWGGDYDTRVGLLDDPLHFSPKTVSLLERLGTDDADTDDIEFLSWENGILSVRGAGQRVWQFSAADLRAELEQL